MECRICKAKPEVIKRCSRCHTATYCSSHCQKEDWLKHRDECYDASMTLAPKRPQRRSGEFLDNILPRFNNNNEDQEAVRPTITFYGFKGCIKTENIPKSVLEQPANITVTLKSSDRKIKALLNAAWPGQYLFKVIASLTAISTDEIKIIIKGKLQTEESIGKFLADKVTAMIIGCPLESAEGLDERDIEKMMSQLHVERNKAVQALKKAGSLIDAMLLVGNA